MKADLSRSTYSAAKHYRDVRLQQGRVQLDADFNEYVDIAAHRVETETCDVVGKCGAPVHDAGFQLVASVAELPAGQQAAAAALGALAPGDFLISAGRFYVDGTLCENDAPMKFSGQEAGDLPGTVPIKTTGLYLAYLDVWARHVTYLDDPLLREVALNGPDTATRNKTVWQVKLVSTGAAGTSSDCAGIFQPYADATAEGTGQLSAQAEPDDAAKKPCILPPGAGYRRLENQLYRVEIHADGSANGKATFKWSRDNGAIVSGWETTASPDVIRLKQPPRDEVMGFAVGMWVEITDDANDLLREPGQLFEVKAAKGDLLTLDQSAPTALTRNPKVRRWDSIGETAVVSGKWLALEDGVQVQFKAGTYRTGDHWIIPARTATANVEWPLDGPGPGAKPAFVPPHGVKHHYCRLGFVDFNGTAIKTHDCRPLFPPLTEIKPGGDLKLHNRHLHGSGVVCGLQVHCAGSDRLSVRIETGHAIDCEGTDILLKSPRLFPAVQRAADLKLIDDKGDAEVLLTLKADTNEQPVFDLRAVPPEDDTPKGILKKILEGTLWMDFYDDCFKPLADYVREQFVTADPNDQALVPMTRRRAIAVANLAVQHSSAPAFHRVWLSKTEHDLLSKIYADLKKFAEGSETFCGLSDTFAKFPDYPFEKQEIRTAFASAALGGVRIAPDGKSAYAFGAGLPGKLFVFDLDKAEMVAELDVPGAGALTVQDIAFVTRGGKPAVLVAAAPADNSRTVLSFLDPGDNAPIGGPIELKGGALSKLEALAAAPRRLLAVQKGFGVHILDSEKLAAGAMPQPRWAFAAAGHLALLADHVCATVEDPGGSGYRALRFGRVFPEDENLDSADTPLNRFLTGVATGQDGLAFALVNEQFRLHVVVDPLPGRAVKSVLSIDADGRKFAALMDLPEGGDAGSATGPVAIATASGGKHTVLALAERDELLWIPALATALPFSQTLPAQITPTAGAGGGGERPQVVVVNAGSQTLTLIPARLLGTTPASETQIVSYRDALLRAFSSLIIPLLQELKDCICEHLLLDCMECEGEDFIPLAKLEIRNRKVHHICNFDRREVLTFPKVKYWLSAVPIIPLIGWLVEKFCCWIIPQPQTAVPGTAGAPSAAAGQGAFSARFMTTAAQWLSRTPVKEALGENLKRNQALATHYLSSLGRQLWAAPDATANSPRTTELLAVPAEIAEVRLADKGIKVVQVVDYDAAMADSEAKFAADKLPADLKAGDAVDLYTRDGKVAFYARTAASSSFPDLSMLPGSAGGATSVAATQVSEELDALKLQLRQMQLAHAQELAARDRSIAELKASVANMDAARSEVEGLRREVAAVRQQQSETKPVKAPAAVRPKRPQN